MIAQNPNPVTTRVENAAPDLPLPTSDKARAFSAFTSDIYARISGQWQSWSSVKHIAQVIALLVLVNICWTMFGRQIISIWRQTHTVDGFIIVDSPEVYTRERLINERLGEDTWLRKQLEEADDDNSLVGVRRTIKTRLAIGAEANQANKAAESDMKLPQGAINSSATSETRLSNNDDILTFDQKVRIKSANRDFIEQRMIENRLDDRHDLAGNSLYVLKFDTTVVSNDFDSRKAVVEVYVVPPIHETARSPNAGNEDSAIDFALGEDPSTLDFIRQSFRQFLKDSKDRINIALAEIPPASPNLDEAIKKFVSQQFGYHEGGAAIIVKQKPLSSDWTQFTLSITGMSDFVNFNYLQKAGAFAAPTFSEQETAFNFRLFDETCISKQKFTNLETQYSLMETLALPESDGSLSNYFASQGNPRIRLLLDPSGDGYKYKGPKNAKTIVRLISKSVQPGSSIGDSSTVPWGRINFEEYAPSGAAANPSDTGAHCKNVYGFINSGFLSFAKSVAESNTYSYSVLPRQSAVSVVDEIVENTASRLSFKAGDGFLSALGIGTVASDATDAATGSSLNSRVTSFGDARQQDVKSGIQIAVGWIIDPKAGRVTPPRNELTTTAESVMAVVSVPSWWPYLKLKIKKSWLNVDGGRQPLSRNDEIFTDSENDAAVENVVVVNLPNSQQLLDSSLIGAGKRGPKLESAVCENVSIADPANMDKSKQEETQTVCVIRGKKLWRNTVVTFGPIEHTALKILPDMEGLIASFPKSSLDCNRGLAVWTSEGRDDLFSNQCKPDGNAILYSSLK